MAAKVDRVVLIVLDSCGCGALPDAEHVASFELGWRG